MARVLADQAAAAGAADAPAVTATGDLDEALRGADFIFSAIRVGGLEGRAADERIALAEGVLGQETVGAGGIAYGLRTVPVVREIARRIARTAPRPGSSTSPTRPGWSPRRWPKCSATGSSGSATRRSDSAAGSPGCSAPGPRTPGSTTWASTTSAGCAACASAGGTSCPGCWPTTRRWSPSRRAASSGPSGCARSARSPTSTCTTTTSTGTRSGPIRRPSRRAAPSCATSSAPSTPRPAGRAARRAGAGRLGPDAGRARGHVHVREP